MHLEIIIVSLFALGSKGALEFEKRIVKGEDAKYKGLYVQVILQKPKLGPQANNICGGTVFMNHWVITHASCVSKKKNQPVTIQYKDFTNEAGLKKEYPVSKEDIHVSKNVDDDGIALIKIPFQSRSLELCKTGGDHHLPQATQMAIAGMGTIKKGDSTFASQLQILPSLEFRRDCPEWLVCSISREGGSTCLYDRGSPLAETRKTGGPKCLYGVVKKSVKECQWSDESIRVSYYEDWIMSIVGAQNKKRTLL